MVFTLDSGSSFFRLDAAIAATTALLFLDNGKRFGFDTSSSLLLQKVRCFTERYVVVCDISRFGQRDAAHNLRAEQMAVLIIIQCIW